MEPIISSIDQKDFPISSSSSSTSSSSSSDSMSYSEASSYMSGASNTVIENTFDEADANGDGAITLNDASVVVNHYKQRQVVTSPEILEVVDIDGQGGLTLNDASIIVNTYRKRF